MPGNQTRREFNAQKVARLRLQLKRKRAELFLHYVEAENRAQGVAWQKVTVHPEVQQIEDEIMALGGSLETDHMDWASGNKR